MSEATKGETDLLADLNEFVRQTANLTADVPPTSGIRPHPQVDVDESVLETKRFGLTIEQQPAETAPDSE